MTALNRLALLLKTTPATLEVPLQPIESLDAIIESLREHAKNGTSSPPSEDHQHAAVRMFWETMRLESLRDARLISFGLCVPSRPSGPCIMEDRKRFQAVLDEQSGVSQWIDSPRWYRRCFQGLLRSYFTYDAKVDLAPAVARQNWGDLRDYLHSNVDKILDHTINPEWVSCALENRGLMGDAPCAPYAKDVLAGDLTKIEYLCEQLGIVKQSWFLRELVLAQVQQATEQEHDLFTAVIPKLLDLLRENLVLRDRGLTLILDKYASATVKGNNEPLRSASVEWWGNPWLPSNEMRWGGVTSAAREMVSEWLKREFIEAFFTKLAEDGVGDRRRANFWLRYVKSMNNIQFALGKHALDSNQRDFQVLRNRMKGLYTELKSTDRKNNAFIMTLGDLVAVEFGGEGNALYGYDVRESLPFDASRPVEIAVNSRNSLKHRKRRLWMQHQDGIKGWDIWEDMFEATLREHFGIRPNQASKVYPAESFSRSKQPVSPDAPRYRLAPSSGAPEASTPTIGGNSGTTPPNTQTRKSRSTFTKEALIAYARAHNLKIEDLSSMNGNLWVRADDTDLDVNQTLLDWGFHYKFLKGWWRQNNR